MNFYQHHIGDFNNATRHLSRIERSIYRDLLELYYDTESPLTSDFDRLARRCIVDDCDRAAMREVLNEFFTLADDGYHNNRADAEIGAYKRMAEGGKRGAEKRWGKANDSHPIATPSTPHAEANANHEPITNNQEPVTNTKPKSAPATPLPDWLQVGSWNDYLETRKVMKAPMTDRAKLLAIAKLSELRQSGHDPTEVLNQSVYNGWKGLFPIKADMNTNAQGKSRHEQHSDFVAELTGRNKRKPVDDPSVIHGTAERLD